MDSLKIHDLQNGRPTHEATQTRPSHRRNPPGGAAGRISGGGCRRGDVKATVAAVVAARTMAASVSMSASAREGMPVAATSRRSGRCCRHSGDGGRPRPRLLPKTRVGRRQVGGGGRTARAGGVGFGGCRFARALQPPGRGSAGGGRGPPRPAARQRCRRLRMGRAVGPPWRGRVVGGAEPPRPVAPSQRRERLAAAAAAAAGGEAQSAASRLGRCGARAGVWRRPRPSVAARAGAAAGRSAGGSRNAGGRRRPLLFVAA